MVSRLKGKYSSNLQAVWEKNSDWRSGGFPQIPQIFADRIQDKLK
jgi:hypothetical protein